MSTGTTSAYDGPALGEMTPRARAIALDWYATGYEHGLLAGHQQADAEHHGRWEEAAAIARHLSARPPYSDLAYSRGQPARAQAQQHLLEVRGITPPRVDPPQSPPYVDDKEIARCLASWSTGHREAAA